MQASSCLEKWKTCQEIWPSVPDESALKATYGNVGGKKNFFACGGLSSVPEQFILTIPPKRTNRKQVKLAQTLVFQKTNVIISSASGASCLTFSTEAMPLDPIWMPQTHPGNIWVSGLEVFLSLKVRHNCKLWRTEFDIFTKNWSWILNSLARIHNNISTQKLEVKGI